MNAFLDWAGYWGVLGIGKIVQRLPLRLALLLGKGVGSLAFYFSRRRKVVYVNLKAAFPESTAGERREWTKGMFQHLAMSGVEILRFPVLKKEAIDRLVTVTGYDTYLEHRAQKKGLILLTAHLGNWELAQIIEAVRGRPLAVLAQRQKFKRLDDLLNSFREHYGSVSVGKGTGIRDLIRVLREGGTAGVLADQSGGDSGVPVRFFGRLTTAPRGPIALALKHDVTVMPVFLVRREGPSHHLSFLPPLELVRTGDREKDIQANTETYVRILESYLRKYPSQWLWGHKRWKRSRTKRVTLLSDGKTGHVKQSETLVKELLEKGSGAAPPYEMKIERIEVRFRSPALKRFFPWGALLFLPWAQGRLHWLRFFLEPECAEKLERTNPDLIVSAGASLAALNLCLARENLAKSVVVMKPSFPFNLFRYDLAVIPAHDRGILPRGSHRIHGALSRMERETLESSKRLLAASLAKPERVRFSLFLGGETRDYRPLLLDIQRLVEAVEQVSEKLDADFLITTSRRTPQGVSDWLRSRFRQHPHCPLCVIASEDGRPEVVPGMMALADFLIVTEDSLSMISEALSTGKNVVVAKMNSNGLPRKHVRFQMILEEQWGVPVVEVERLGEVLSRLGTAQPTGPLQEERLKLRERLGALL